MFLIKDIFYWRIKGITDLKVVGQATNNGGKNWNVPNQDIFYRQIKGTTGLCSLKWMKKLTIDIRVVGQATNNGGQGRPR